MNILLDRRRKESGPIPLFVLEKSVIEAITYEEALETVRALCDMGVCKLPYPQIALKFDAYALLKFWDSELARRIEANKELDQSDRSFFVTGILDEEMVMSKDPGFFNSETNGSYIIEKANGTTIEIDMKTRRVFDVVGDRRFEVTDPISKEVWNGFEDQSRMVTIASFILLTALASPPNVVDRVSTFNKRATRGIGNGQFKGHGGMIYISRTVFSVSDAVDATGRIVKPHIRRGHVSHYWVGPKNKEQRRIEKWIAPTKINAPPEFKLIPKDYTLKR